jgi:hypothetical protein
MRTLNERNFMVGIERSVIVGNVPPHRHNNFIVLDLACENARQLLDEVRAKKIVSGVCFQRSRGRTATLKELNHNPDSVARLKLEIQLTHGN